MHLVKRLVVMGAVLAVASAVLPAAGAAETTVSLNPPSADQNINTTFKMSAKLTDAAGAPMEGVELLWAVVSGPNAGTPLTPCTTDPDGRCVNSYAGDGGPGTDSVRVTADLDADGFADPEEPTDTSSIEWVDVPEDACLDAETEGASAPETGEIVLTVTVTNTSGATGDDTCEGQPLPGIDVTSVAVDDVPDTYVSSINGQAVSNAADPVTVETNSSGQFTIGYKLVQADPADHSSQVRLLIAGVRAVTDPSPEQDGDPEVDLVALNWEATPDNVGPSITGVKASPNPFTPNGDGRRDTTRISFTLSESATTTVKVKRSGNVIRTLMSTKTLTAGSHSVKWNGRKANGNKAKAGRYTFVIVAVDAAGNSSKKTGTVTLRR